MQLKEYPAAIAKAARNIYRLEGDVWDCRNQLAALEWQIEAAIAHDPDLKNDQQRKARRLELQQASDSQTARETLKKAEARLEQAQIQVTLLRDTFRIEILETRERIARLEADRMIA
jgi:crotonobetainyl-CoA:carnitine CoA-transferase CaiB-like acyl-CoA transferase